MRVLIGIVLFVAISWIVVLKSGVASYDPTGDGLKAKEVIKAGMSWQDVAEKTRPPKKFRWITRVPSEDGDEIKPGFPLKFNQEDFTKQLGAGSHTLGFIFEYNYSAQVGFSVYFTPEGKVEYVQDKMKVEDMFR
ncbi:MAG: hypothetical protein OER86_00735 [Phycisphaerae bacterium]|nr:hypothetical protein [Phycisphaerae bacterium]